MFRRLWSGLPKDPHFPSGLEELGYFVNEDDEIRSIEEPKNYFKFFLSKNERFNERQRFAMNEACEKLVHLRMEKLGLNRVLLPLGVTDPAEPNLPIFVSADIKQKSRVVIIFGESFQDLGVQTQRVLSGPGGVDKGSMVSIVKEIQKQQSTPSDNSPPGIILANTGQMIWSPELKRTMTFQAAEGAPMPSAVHQGMYLTEKNHVPENSTKKEHIKYIFEKVVPAFVDSKAVLDLIGVGDGSDAVEEYLDWSVTWARVQSKINSFSIVGGYHPAYELKCEGFIHFLRERACAWTVSSEDLGIALSGPEGNPHTTTFTAIGCPIFSGGEKMHVETLLITCHPAIMAWQRKVAITKDYKNPILDVAYADVKLDAAEPDWTEHVKAWEQKKAGPVKEEKVDTDADSDD